VTAAESARGQPSFAELDRFVPPAKNSRFLTGFRPDSEWRPFFVLCFLVLCFFLASADQDSEFEILHRWFGTSLPQSPINP